MSVNTKCQVFTPRENVQELLDAIEYKNDLFGKKVAENSCGDGSVLAEIVDRYIIDGMKQNLPLDTIKMGLEEDIWGAEIDKTHIVNCKLKLNEVVSSYGISDVHWNVFEGDFLKKNIIGRFDFVIGNPPYITYKELDMENRAFIRDAFETCAKGKFDYCYAFIEASLKSLKDTGKLAYLIPSNIFKNQFALDLRNYILPYLTDIYDYSNKKLFTGKLTASAIIVCDRNNLSSSFVYHNISEDKINIIQKDSLKEKWMFIGIKLEAEYSETRRFGDYFHAASSIATLLNEVYIIDDFVGVSVYKVGFIDDDQTTINDYKIRLKRKDIELFVVEDCGTKQEVVEWILKNEIKCMLVDYKLTGAYDFNGTQLVAFINSELPDLPCVILSNYCESGKEEKLVIENLFIDRDVLAADFDSSEFENLINVLKQAVDVFDNRLKLHLAEYQEIKVKKESNSITAREEERLINLFKILRSYNEVDDLPAELLTTNTTKKMSDILQSLNKLIDKTK